MDSDSDMDSVWPTGTGRALQVRLDVPSIVMVPCISTDLFFLPMNTTLTFLSINKLHIIFLYCKK